LININKINTKTVFNSAKTFFKFVKIKFFYGCKDLNFSDFKNTKKNRKVLFANFRKNTHNENKRNSNIKFRIVKFEEQEKLKNKTHYQQDT
jgi:hypothetical protein